MAVAYAIAHLPTLAPSLEDIDSINFALGLRHFDPGQHQPHPPGYPLYIAAGHVTLAVAQALWSGLERAAIEARALSLLSVLGGALAVAAAFRLFDLLARDADPQARPRVRLWATLLLAACPLFWITGLRPMSDVPGLAAAIAAQALLLAGWPRTGALVAGLALGIRSQVLWLTAPLIAFDLYRAAVARAWSRAAAIVLAAAAGALAWAVPLVALTGGIEAYLTALGSQAGEDFAFVDMLWRNPTPRQLAFGLIHTLVMPWGSYPLAGIVLAAALVGGVVLLMRERRVFGLLLLAFAPYAVFHLVFQETVTVRYALPVMVPIAFMAARGIAVAGRAVNFVATPLAVLSLMSGIAGALAYARSPHPAFRAIADARTRATVGPPGIFASHFELRRALRVASDPVLPVTYAPHQREWLELVSYWTKGGRETAWFLANPRRADLDLIDPYSRHDVVRYRWSAGGRLELSGTRPDAADWYRLRPPGWFLGEGWSLTPEAGGLTQALGTGPERRPIVAHVRRQSVPMHGVVGGRHLGGGLPGPATLEAALDGSVVDRWVVTPEEPSFLRFLDLPDGVPEASSDYATLSIRVLPARERSHGVGEAPREVAPPVAIRQFDVQPKARPVFGYGAGWHDEELEAGTGLRWRWTDDRAVLRIQSASHPVRVRLRGESPLKYFAAAPTITVTAGKVVLERFQLSDDWQRDLTVPADAFRAGVAEVSIATTHVFVPAKVTASPDSRRLGLRIFAVNVQSAR